MADLAGNASASLLRILGPVITGYRARVDQIDESLGLGRAVEKFPDAEDMRCKSTVKADHQVARFWERSPGIFDFIELFRLQSEWLLDKDMLLCAKRLANQSCVAVVSCCDHHGIDVRV